MRNDKIDPSAFCVPAASPFPFNHGNLVPEDGKTGEIETAAPPVRVSKRWSRE